jgi:glycerol-3-phosphate acyltransferase PlsY
VLVAVVCFALGYVLGSLPLPSLIGRMAGLDTGAYRTRDVAREAGPGWGLLALASDLARGVLPVALAVVTFGWIAGLAAGVGAAAGTMWPAASRLPGDRSPGLVVGVLLVLVPIVGVAAALLGAAVAWVRRSPGR